ncbi:MAG: cytochrome-c peroxidase [Bacteroidota bacterium]
MLYRTAVLLLLGIVLLATTIDKKNTTLEKILLTHIDVAMDDVKMLEHKPNLKRLTRLRSQILTLSWTFAPLQLEEAAASINNNKYNIEQAVCGANVGLLQLWEKELLEEKKIVTKDFETFHSFLQLFKSKIQNHDWQDREIFTALLLDHYNLYVEVLSGSHHFQTKQVSEDYKKVLYFHSLILESIGKREELNSDYKKLSRVVGKQKFEDIDRVELLKKHIQPIHNQLIVLIGNDAPEWADHLNLDQEFFSGNWLRSEAFIDVNENLDSQKLAQLGQLLFFDPLLSGNDKRTCASCHQAQKAFSDGRSTSLGFDYLSKLEKNSPSLINSIFNYQFGHDLSKTNLAEQIDFVVHQAQEFRTTYAEIIQKLNTSSEYIQLFEECFPDKRRLDSTQINQALEAYLGTLVSFESPFDRFMRDETELNSTALEGYKLFMGKAQCGTCHQAPLFSGLNATTTQKVQNYACEEIIKVKTPSVRNLQFTMPYFHRGTLNSQEDLFEHLFNNVKQNIHSNNLLTSTEQQKVVAFLESLNDKSAVNFDTPKRLPKVEKTLNKMERRAGGIY